MRQIFGIFIILIFFSCRNDGNKISESKTLEKLRHIEKAMSEKSELDKNLASQYITAASELLKSNSKDTSNITHLYKAAALARTGNNVSVALTFYESIFSNHPNHRLASEAMFISAFINDSELKQFGRAKELYSIFIKNYPKHNLVNDAKFLVNNIGKDDAQLLDEAMKNNKKN